MCAPNDRQIHRAIRDELTFTVLRIALEAVRFAHNPRALLATFNQWRTLRRLRGI